MNSNDLINAGAKILRDNKIVSHQIDSEIILSNLIKSSREKLLINPNKKIKKNLIKKFNELIKRRVKGQEPIAYIFNRKEFWNSKLFVNKDTLIPRPETELLVEKISQLFKNSKPLILDVGTGSGCILISILEELKKAKGVAIDISPKALKVAKKNAKKNNTYKKIRFFHKSITSTINMKFDIIVSNPPYVAKHQLKNLSGCIKFFEPKIALDGGNDGLDVIRKVIYKSKDILKLNGMLAIEIGNGQYKKVSQILKFYKFREKFLIKDFQNNIRCILSVLSKHN